MDWLYVAQDTQAEGTVLPGHLETKPLMCHRRQAVAFYGTFVPYLESRPTTHQRYEQTPHLSFVRNIRKARDIHIRDQITQ